MRSPTRNDAPRLAPLVRRVAAVIPARDEQDLVGSALRNVTDAIARAAQHYPHTACDVVLVADSCVDRTSEIASALGAHVVAVRSGRVGAARHAGAVVALQRARSAGVPPSAVWIANTDADTWVPSHWITRQLDLAARGVQAVVGSVEPVGVAPDVLAHWRSLHQHVEGHPHVHGANLGVRGDAYLACGGFDAVGLHEDRDLVARLRASGLPVRATDTTRVRTSGRADARVRGGFGDYLTALTVRPPA